MFYHDNGQLKVITFTRCGNTSMSLYFGITPTIKDSITGENNSRNISIFEGDKNLILVLRNPLDRVVSAVKGIDNDIVKKTNYYQHIRSQNLLKKIRFPDIKEYEVFRRHCSPRFENFKNIEFRIIDFYKLNDYIPNFKKSPTTNSSGYANPKEVYVKNRYFTLEDLEREYELYQQFIREKEQISIEEWKEKTP